ncbi:MAG: ABC transporter substrate-binding protein [Burkholderiales bacterium]|nr:ABC transporter substrate-binding protein [Anaerolineae bacterium]
MAESWDISADGLTYTFHLREGVMFQPVAGVEYESREVTAADWVWSMMTYLSADTEISEHPEYLASIVGAPEFTEGAGEVTEVEGINVVDDYTLELTLSEPNHRFLYDLINVYVVPQEAFETVEEFGNNPVGTGPYMLGEWLRDDHLTLTANPEYWEAGLPLTSEVRFLNIADANTELLMYRENELDLLLNFPTGQFNALKTEFVNEYHEMPGLNVRYYGFKMDVGFFSENPLVRQAMAHAVNNEEIWNILLEGQRVPGTMGVLSPSMPAANAGTQTYDPALAAELLTEAGFPGGEGLPTFDLYILGSMASSPAHEAMQAQFAEIGVPVNLVVEDGATYWDHIDQDDVEFFVSGWSSDFNDPSEVLNFLFLDGADQTHYNNEEVNALIREAMTITDPTEREAIYRQAHEMIMAETPWIVSSYSIISYLQKSWVDGFTITPSGTYTAELKYVSVAEGQG